MLCTVCKKREATVRIYDEPLCDECKLVVEALIKTAIMGYVEEILGRATKKIGGGDEGDNDSQGTQRKG